MSRQRTPTAAKKANGTYRPSRHGGEPEPGIAIPTAPPHLSAAARAEWDRLVPELYSLRMLTELDRGILAKYCVAYARWVEAEEQVTAAGTVIKAPTGYPIQNPYLAIANKTIEQMHKLGNDLGLSPAARSKVKVDKGQEADSYDAIRNS